MPSVSKAQQHLFGMCYGAAKAGHPKAGCPKMPVGKLREFAATKARSLPAFKRKRK